MQITVYGAGAWGTALAIAYANSHQVTLWGRDTEALARCAIERTNHALLPDAPFPDALVLEPDLHRAGQGADLHLVVTPVAGLRAVARHLAAEKVTAPLIWACKGFESGTGKLPHQVVDDELGTEYPCGVLTGPSFAAEVAAGLPTAITLAARDTTQAAAWVAELHQPRLRLYDNDDLIGAEVGGAVKNVMAIAAGVSDGLGFGLNSRAALITRGLAEMARLGVALGARQETFMGLAGMGDLVLTCTGDLSRNRRVGLALAEGKPLAQILHDLGHVAEGVLTTRETVALAHRHQVEMPITEGVDALLSGTLSAREAVERLLARDPRSE
ncbi:NAD(P)H-dependent glycerol-3-phosphate dehydrogenase [Denitromonas iodatirespirans]|uniref:Glycerol-3-phosphate dehydrogenase [NAD(P)+] n=1 Tax=Denitromonas iodatirespirans TaxID=2795389 RepID=A0A944DKN4_DENI1|nr:NAD(P)H-dependent glycerol-3-phosphate dehydrogenase [Denitromonas iodatirespirans]MBT0960499.1 NAD(P)-dependent glycerol-3-phosphate dehydrogenase [Denitromonas iodatirespirans]